MKNKNLFPRIFGWMFLGLLVTFSTSFYVASQPLILKNIFGGINFWLIIIAEFALVIFLSTRATKMNYGTAAITFLVYSWLSGLTFTAFLVVYRVESVIFIFGITALVFGLFALIGYTTKLDLTKMGSLLLMALIGVIIATLVNMLIGSSLLDIILSCAIILIFVGLTAYDIQKIKKLGAQVDDPRKIAIIGALTLYLDFINLFIQLLNLFGSRR